jgi:hypothetical protein
VGGSPPQDTDSQGVLDFYSRYTLAVENLYFRSFQELEKAQSA